VIRQVINEYSALARSSVLAVAPPNRARVGFGTACGENESVGGQQGSELAITTC
jgi:hypothetical protein